MSDTQENFMPKVDGKPFRCGCGCNCNVFHKPDPQDDNKFRCNGCRQDYTSEIASGQREQPDGAAATAGAGLVADLEQLTREGDEGSYYMDSQDVIEAAAPYDQEIVRLRARVRSLEAQVARLTDELESAEARADKEGWKV